MSLESLESRFALSATQWINQFGSSISGDQEAKAIALDGSVYITGFTDRALPGQAGAGAGDAFLRKLDAAGNELWTRQLGSAATDISFAIHIVDSRIFIAGVTLGALPGQANQGGLDSFIIQYDAQGNQVWARQIGSAGRDRLLSLTSDSTGLYAAGEIDRALPGQVFAGGSSDVFVSKFDLLTGADVWTRELGSPGTDFLAAIASDGTNVYVVGSTDSTFPGQTRLGNFDTFLAKFDNAGNAIWTAQTGTANHDLPIAAAADADGLVIVGSTAGTFAGETNSGGHDAFVSRYNVAGGLVWAKQFGTPAEDDAAAVQLVAGGLYIAGTTGGTFSGQVSAGNNDVFVRYMTDTCRPVWTQQFGGPADDQAAGVAVDSQGVFLAGSTNGALPGQISFGGHDAFVAKLANQPAMLTDVSLTPSITEGGIATLVGTLIDSDGGDLPELWVDWGDGSPEEQIDLSETPGAFTATHVYTDNASALATAFDVRVRLIGGNEVLVPIEVANATPTATFEALQATDVLAEFGFSDPSDASVQDRGVLRYSYDFDGDSVWDLGDGTYAGSVASSSAVVTPSRLGLNTARGRVLDKDGGFTDYATSYTVIDDDTAPPEVTFTGADSNQTDGQSQNFQWQVTDPAGLSSVLVTVTRDAGSGPVEIYRSASVASSGSLNFDAYGLGRYEIVVVAADGDNDRTDDGATTTVSRTVVVTDDDEVPPAVFLSGSTGIELDSQSQYFRWNIEESDGVSSRPLQSLSITVTRDLGAGPEIVFQTNSLRQYRFDFDTLGAGVYEVTVRAADADNDWTGDQLDVTATRRVEVRSATGIVWMNRGTASDRFDDVFGAQAGAARAVVDAAITKWNEVVTGYNYSDGTSGFAVSIAMNSDRDVTGLASGDSGYLDANGVPRQGGITFGAGFDGLGSGWWLDPTPLDSSEFNNPTSPFSSVALAGSPAYQQRDFLSTVLHELGHSLGIVQMYLEGAAERGRVSLLAPEIPSSNQGYRALAGASFTTSLINGGHIAIESRDYSYTDPVTGLTYTGSEDLLNPTRPNGVRRTISNLDALILQEAYGFSVRLPETIGNYYAKLDDSTGILTIKGISPFTGFTIGSSPSNDTIRVTRQGDVVTVSVDLGTDLRYMTRLPGASPLDPYVSHFPASSISSIRILPGDGDDSVILEGWAGSVFVDGQDGFDHTTIYLSGLDSGGIEVTDGGVTGSDDLTIFGTDANDEITKDETTVSWTQSQNVVTYTNVGPVAIFALDGDDIIHDPGQGAQLFGGLGNDTIIITATTGTGVFVDGGEGSDQYVVDGKGLNGPVSLSDSGTGGRDNFELLGTPDSDLFVQSSAGFTLNGVTINLGAGVEQATFDGGGGIDQQLIDGTPPVAEVSIVTPINTAPDFTSAAAFSVAEDTQSIVGQILATDVDDPASVTIGITGGADRGLFTLSSLGVLSFTATPDFELARDADGNNLYEVELTASDNHGGFRIQLVTVTVFNINEPPQIVSSSVSAVRQEGTPISVAASAIDPTAAVEMLTYSYSVLKNGSLFRSESGLDQTQFGFTPDDNGSYEIVLTVSDDEGGRATASQIILVSNVDPTPVIESVSTLWVEGTEITVTASATDPAGANDTLTYRYQVLKNGGPILSMSGIDQTSFHFTPDDNGRYEIVLRVSDEDGGESSESVIIMVSNVAPIANDDARSTEQASPDTFDPAADDSDPAGGDDALSISAVTQPSNGLVVLNSDGTVTYTPDSTFAGTDSFSYTVEDGDGGYDTATVTIAVAPAAPGSIRIVSDSAVHGGTALLITGTPAGDTINVEPGATSETLNVVFNGLASSWSKPSGRIIVTGGAGNDNIQIAGAIQNIVWLAGDAGDDRLNAGGGGSLIIGGGGNDQLIGGGGRDIMVGGEGADKLMGNSNDDILVAGYTTKDERGAVNYERFWRDVLAAWNSTQSFSDRVSKLRSQGSLLPQVVDDVFADSIDFLNGAAGEDWLIFTANEDTVSGKAEAQDNPQ